MLTRTQNLVAAGAGLMLLAAVPVRARADAFYYLQLRPTEVEPCASGDVTWGFEYTLHPRHSHSVFDVEVRGIFSTDLVQVCINGVPLDDLIALTDGAGALWLDSDYGDDPPWLNPGDRVEIFDAYDGVTILL
jgi:hypothetical protein